MLTKTQINKLGKSIRENIKNEDTIPVEDLEKLQEYRTSYKSDLSSVFGKIAEITKDNRKDNIISFRIKRIESILSKIKRQPTMSLGNMGDIAGCRILVHNENSISNLIEQIDKNFTITSFKNYLETPKEDGYRGYHLYIESPINKNKLIEIQIRTIKCHTWASMVEIIDILYNLKIKEGEHHPDFERFLILLSRIEELTFDEKKRNY